jgi:hypothetical protein
MLHHLSLDKLAKSRIQNQLPPRSTCVVSNIESDMFLCVHRIFWLALCQHSNESSKLTELPVPLLNCCSCVSSHFFKNYVVDLYFVSSLYDSSYGSEQDFKILRISLIGRCSTTASFRNGSEHPTNKMAAGSSLYPHLMKHTASSCTLASC